VTVVRPPRLALLQEEERNAKFDEAKLLESVPCSALSGFNEILGEQLIVSL